MRDAAIQRQSKNPSNPRQSCNVIQVQYHQENIVEALRDQRHMLDKTIEKIEGGLTMEREKYAEERLYRMRDKE